MPNFSSKQIDIFSDSSHKLHYAELCTALYERELTRLSTQAISNVSVLQRKLGGLKHHVKRIADTMLQKNSPLEIDIHNGSWRAKQASQCPAKRYDPDKCLAWYASYTLIGHTVPIHVQELGEECIELDSIDRIDQQEGRLHANKYGWFTYQGDSVKPEIDSSPIANQAIKATVNLQLLKPNKAILTAASCGHCWDHKGKSQPRTLTLREMLLSLSVNWKTFR
jgi:hypothetical protein